MKGGDAEGGSGLWLFDNLRSGTVLNTLRTPFRILMNDSESCRDRT